MDDRIRVWFCLNGFYWFVLSLFTAMTENVQSINKWQMTNFVRETDKNCLPGAFPGMKYRRIGVSRCHYMLIFTIILDGFSLLA